jgi:AcrR family transcriptional regulator
MSSQKRGYELKARADVQRETRRRIVEATAELHQEVGPAQTTMSEIARRAGVNRATIYNHFPDEAELFGACQAHWLTLHPLPDLAPALALEDPAERVRAALGAQYAWYRETEPMAEKIQRDRAGVPALDALMQRTADAGLTQLAGALTAGLGSRGARAERQAALVRLALEFWTWRSLTRGKLDDSAAADLMTAAIACAPESPNPA